MKGMAVNNPYVPIDFRNDIVDANGNRLCVYTTPIVDLMKAIKRMEKQKKNHAVPVLQGKEVK